MHSTYGTRCRSSSPAKILMISDLGVPVYRVSCVYATVHVHDTDSNDVLVHSTTSTPVYPAIIMMFLKYIHHTIHVILYLY